MGVAAISVPPHLAAVLQSAGEKSDVDFGYLVQTAIRESSLNPNARARTSSAVGLFQFLESTWLEVMKSEGPRLGYQNYADAIVQRNGDYSIPDRALRAEVLKLREDPQIAADLAAAFTRNNGAYLAEKFGRMPSPGELYIAHFLGARGAEKLFQAGLENPDQIAARLFPRQAAANRAIFYEGGRARTIRDVYRALVAKHEVLQAPAVSPTNAGFQTQQIAASTAPVPATRPIGLQNPGPASLSAPAPLQVPGFLVGATAVAPAPDASAAAASLAMAGAPGAIPLSGAGHPDPAAAALLFASQGADGPSVNVPRVHLTPVEPPSLPGFFVQLHRK